MEKRVRFASQARGQRQPKINTMKKLTCGCLNVKIFVRDLDLNMEFKNDLQLDMNMNDAFFMEDLVKYQLEMPGMEQEQPFLVHKQISQGWAVYRCLCCGMSTHAVYVKPGRAPILVNSKMEDDGVMIERLQRSSNYSSVFKILMPAPDTDDNAPSFSELQYLNFESLQPQLDEIQQQINLYLNQEEQAMEERIRAYEQEQRSNFGDLQSRTQEEKKNLISVLLRGHQNPSSHNSAINSRRDIFSNKQINQTTVPKPNQSPKKSKPHNVRRGNGLTNYSIPPGDDDDMFQFEDDRHQDDMFFDMSDEEDEDRETDATDTDDSSQIDEIGLLSASVPINVPHEFLRRKSMPAPALPVPIQDEALEEHVPGEAPENIAANIQAMAQSVRNDSTSIFGERPRPRVYTFSGGRAT